MSVPVAVVVPVLPFWLAATPAVVSLVVAMAPPKELPTPELALLDDVSATVESVVAGVPELLSLHPTSHAA